MPVWDDLIALTLIGLLTGVVGGMLGIGGSIVMIPAMTEVLGPDQHLYQSAAMIVNFFVVVPAVLHHKQAGALQPATLRRLVPLAALFVVFGVLLSELPVFHNGGERRLRGLFGLFLLMVVLADLCRLLRRRREGSSMIPQASTASSKRMELKPVSPNDVEADGQLRNAPCTWWLALAIALPTGLTAGLLGVGGGLLAVPLQRRLLNTPIRNAIANSAALIVIPSLIGATVKNYAYLRTHAGDYESFVLAIVLIPTAMLGSLAGSRLTHRAPLDVVKGAFFVLLLVAALRLVYGALLPGGG